MNVNIGNCQDADLFDRAERFEPAELERADRITVARIDGLADEIVRCEKRQSVTPAFQAVRICVECKRVELIVRGTQIDDDNGSGGRRKDVEGGGIGRIRQRTEDPRTVEVVLANCGEPLTNE